MGKGRKMNNFQKWWINIRWTFSRESDWNLSGLFAQILSDLEIIGKGLLMLIVLFPCLLVIIWTVYIWNPIKCVGKISDESYEKLKHRLNNPELYEMNFRGQYVLKTEK